MSYVQKQREWLKKHNVKEGDKFYVTRKAEQNEGGWECSWEEDHMTPTVGKIIEYFRTDDDEDGLCMRISDEDNHDRYWYPYFVLAPVKLAPKYGDKLSTASRSYYYLMPDPNDAEKILCSISPNVIGGRIVSVRLSSIIPDNG